MDDLSCQVSVIIAINHAWKRQSELRGADHLIALSLQQRKSSLQVSLLRQYPNATYLRVDTDNEEGEALYSVRLRNPIMIASHSMRSDAEHLPVRIAIKLLAQEELEKMVCKT